jgi:ribosomal protein S18 acetylase RimI-like enzyme
MVSDAKSAAKVIIRRMREEDIEGVLAIDRKIVGKDRAATYDTMPRSYVGGELDVSVVAEIDDEIVGFLLGRMTESSYDLGNSFLLDLIGVDPDYRRHGIGRRLVEAFEQQCQEKGGATARAMVSWHDWWLLSFLGAMGFVRGEMAEFVKQIEDR